MSRLYLDNAATSLPKPPAVYETMHQYVLSMGASPGRGNYREAREGARLFRQCRQRLGTLFNADSPDHMIFCLNCSDANNMAIQGLVRHARRTDPARPIHLVTSELDHNSVLRPFRDMEQDGVTWTCVPCDPATGAIDPRRIADAITPHTLLVVLTHASNVLGTIQPVAEIGEICRGRGVLFMLDAAQTAGHVPIDVKAMNVDLLTAPGHKGLLGPMGTGMLWIRPGLESRIDPYRQGGTGSRSELDVQPTILPDKYEAGSHNAPGIVALGAAVEWLLSQTVQKLRTHEVELTGQMLEGLARLHSYRLLGNSLASQRVGIFSLVHRSIDCHTLATVLEDQFDILARAGLHCAPRTHAAYGTSTTGALRLSLSVFTKREDVDRTLAALEEIDRVSH